MVADEPTPHGPSDTWDAFLSYNSRDLKAVEAIAKWLEDEAGLRIFFDRWRLVPGGDSQGDLSRAIAGSRTCVVCMGGDGLGPWQTEEVREIVRLAVQHRRLRVIPLFLAGSTAGEADLPVFVSSRTWCDLRGDHEDGMERLRSGILGLAPGRRGGTLPDWLGIEIGRGALREPTGLAASGGACFVADRQEGRLVKFAADGTVTERGGLDRPHHVTTAKDMVVVCDTYADRLVAYDLDLNPLWSRSRGRAARFRRPHGVGWTPRLGLLILNSDRHQLEVLDVDERRQVKAATGPSPLKLSTPCGIAAAPGHVLLADTFAHRVLVLGDRLKVAHEFGRHGYGIGEFSYPVAVACWHEHVVVSDEHNQRLQLWRVWKDDEWRSELLESDVLGEHLGSPFGLDFDRFGDLLIADRKHGRVLRLDLRRYLAERASA